MKESNKTAEDSAEVKRGKGKPRRFATEEEFYNKFMEYINYCKREKRFANIAGFSAYCKMDTDTYYAQKQYYSVTFKKCEALLEDTVLQDNTTRSIFYLKNKFGYADKQEIENTNKNYAMSDADKQLLQKVSKRIDSTENKA